MPQFPPTPFATKLDAKPAYSADLPRFFGYARRVAGRYSEFRPLLRLLDELEGVQREVGYTF